VTTVRDLGDWHFNVVQRRDAQRQVDDGLPWIVASGPPITTPGGHCGYLGGEVSGADEIVAAVRERVERRVDVVKVMALVAASSDGAAAIGLGRSKGRLRRGYNADLLVVDGDLAADLTALRDVRQVVLRGVPVSPRPGQS
jgi:imidazolonepropionase-like amidohydrolase